MSRTADADEGGAARALAALVTRDELSRVELTLDDAGQPAAGSRPAAIFRDAAGRRYFFKSASPGHVAAEIFASEVRRLGHRPTVATAARTLTLPGVGEVFGMVQPLVDHAGGRLDVDATKWRASQRATMLREHPWEWLLANLDTHVDQYILFGPGEVPVNIDWDHALEDLHVVTLDRFTKRSPTIVPIRNALYDAYVRGDVALPWRDLWREVRRIATLDDRALARLLATWAETAGVDDASRRLTCERFFARKRALGRTFRLLSRDLRRERLVRLHPDRSLPLGDRARIALQDAWQRLVIETLHDHAVAPALRVHRRLLAARDAWLRPRRS